MDIREMCEKIRKRSPAYTFLFLVSGKGFCFNTIGEILDNKKIVSKLDNWISKSLQQKYLNLANDWLFKHKE